MIYLSLGAGVQSSALAVLSALELRGCPRADVAIFADTRDEPWWVYAQLEAIGRFLQEHGIPLQIVSAGCLSEHIQDNRSGKRKRFAAIPAFTRNDAGEAALLPRQCTQEYKIEPIARAIRARMGYKPRQRIKERATALIGISVDEATRQKPSRSSWIDNVYPLVDAGMTRSACLEVLRLHGLPVPKKSACVFCPYRNDEAWLDIKDHDPEGFAKAVAVDRLLRDGSRQGLARPLYLHRSLLPLEEIDFRRPEPRGLLELFENECEGHCGV